MRKIVLKVSSEILPKLHRTRKQFRMDTFYAGGPGGQYQNKTETGVRITDLVTGLSAESRVHRSQRQNRVEAFEKLVRAMATYYEKERLRKHSERFKEEKDTVRTYNFKRKEVIDHKTGHKGVLKPVLNGNLGGFIRAAQMKEAENRLG